MSKNSRSVTAGRGCVGIVVRSGCCRRRLALGAEDSGVRKPKVVHRALARCVSRRGQWVREAGRAGVLLSEVHQGIWGTTDASGGP